MPVVNLSAAPGAKLAWDRPRPLVFAWGLAELLLVVNPLQVSSRLRAATLRAFGAQIGAGVVIRPRTRVKFPWKLEIGDRSWIGEGVWFHNQDRVIVGADAVISQETFVTTGSHAHRRDMALLTRPIVIEDGAWITARCIVLGGTHVGRSAVVSPGSVISGAIPVNCVWQGGAGEGRAVGPRFEETPHVHDRE
ncbi:acetyltransferase [Kocuria flava]|uniref:Acetyltransferase n=1 Tax=Kocuria flava TaxID=446860 RepID=A0A2N4T4R1_9MICC|nr:acetyltransferase [Kocuria flava]